MTKLNPRLVVGNIYHIYNRAVADTLLFNHTDNYHFFVSRMMIHLDPTADILAYCLMPNHYHLLILLNNDDLPRSMQKLALSYVVPFNKSFDRSGHLFQGKYQRKLVEDENYLLHLSRYIHLNPVAAGLVDRPLDWRFSSLSAYYGLAEMDFIRTDIILDHFDDPGGTSLIEKRFSYKMFLDEWDPEYMSFKEK